MYEPQVTLQGRVASEPRITHVAGASVASMRVRVAPRRYDRSTNEWREADNFHVTLRCWRQLADNIAQSFQVGHPLIATGRLNIRTFVDDRGRRRMSVDFEATAAGHDLSFGQTTFSNVRKAVDQQQAMRQAVDETADWAYPDGEEVEGVKPVEERPAAVQDESESPSGAEPRRAADDGEGGDAGESPLIRAA